MVPQAGVMAFFHNTQQLSGLSEPGIKLDVRIIQTALTTEPRPFQHGSHQRGRNCLN